MRMVQARRALVGLLFLAMAGCQNGGGGSWWSPNPFRSAASPPADSAAAAAPSVPKSTLYPQKPSQLYAGTATSSPSTGFNTGSGAGSPTSPIGVPPVGGGPMTAGSPSFPGGTASFPGAGRSPAPGAAPTYPGAPASYNALSGSPAASYPASPSVSGGGFPSAGSATASDAAPMTAQRGRYEIPSSVGGPTAGGVGGSYPSAGGYPGSAAGSYPAAAGSPDASPFRSPTGSGAGASRFDTPSNRFGNNGADRGKAPADPFARPNVYSKPDPYAKPDPYSKPDPYAKPTDPYVAPGGSSYPSTGGANPYGAGLPPRDSGFPSSSTASPYRMPTASALSPSSAPVQDDPTPFRPGSVKDYNGRTSVAGGVQSDANVTPAGLSEPAVAGGMPNWR